MTHARKSFVTKAGTELSLLNLKGKEYLMAAQRIQWFREENPGGIIKTQLLHTGGEGKDTYYIFKAEVYIPGPQGPVLVATAHKRETVGDFPDALEKSETSAIARCLALSGYGTQFTADELDEGTRLADSPVENFVAVKAPASSKFANKAAPVVKAEAVEETEVAEVRKPASFTARMRASGKK